jgi:hypothetical protein
MEAPDTTDAIISYLAAQGATAFSKLIYNIPKLFGALSDPKLSIIVAPNDAALQRLSVATGKPLTEIQKDAYAIDILANHVSIVPTQKTFPMITSINQNTYGSSEQDIQALKVSAFTRISQVSVLVIGEIIIYPNQVEKASLKRDLGVLKPLQQNDTLFVLIQKGDIKGKDLISLCVSDPELNKLCNAKLDFNYLLKRDYSSTAPPGTNPRDYYVKLSTGFKGWTTLVGKSRWTVHNMDIEIENSFMQNLQPLDFPVGFVASAAGASRSFYLTDDGTVYQVNRITSRAPGYQLIPYEFKALPKIMRIKAVDNLLIMLDVNDDVWAYGDLHGIDILNRYFIEPNRDPLPAGQPLVGSLAVSSRIDTIYVDKTFNSPHRLNLANHSLKGRIFDIAIEAYNSKSLMIILENEKPELYGDASVISVTIETITRNTIIVNTRIGKSSIRRQFIEAVVLQSNWTYLSSLLGGLPITETEVVKVEEKFILDDQGRLWPNYVLPPAANKVQVVYPAEPNLKFLDVVDSRRGITWAFSEDGRLFAIAISVSPSRRIQLPNTHLTLYSAIQGVVSMDINPGEHPNVAILTKWG